MTMSTSTTGAPERVPRPGALPYLAVVDARAAIAFYAESFGAGLVGEPYVMGDGRIGHAELALGGGAIYLSDAHPELGVVAPAADGASVSLVLAVDDTDMALARARAAGARVVREAYENYGARNATIVDPFGHRWMLSGPVAASGPADPIRPGDIGYISWWTADGVRAARFYGAVLGWAYDTDSGHRRHLRGTTISTGIDGGHDHPTLYCCYAMPDVDDGVARVRELGGSADEPTDERFGRTAMCRDRDGMEFALWQPGPGTTRPPANGVHAGDVAYLTYGVPESSAFREFYGALFGWTFTAGRVADGWEPDGGAPMSGMRGGAERATVTPMWLVEDIETAVERVVVEGGRVLEQPDRQPYGISAYCADDQGGRFYLLET